MTEIRETLIPGVGTCLDFPTRAGRRMGVIRRASGRREVVVYSRSDPDAVQWQVDLDAEEAATLAELLEEQTVVQREGTIDGLIEGLAVDWMPIPDDFEPQPIGALAIRTRTGATVVATVGERGAVPAPGPDHVLVPGDTAVVIGTPEGLTQVADLFQL